jgi:hypothetical protein
MKIPIIQQNIPFFLEVTKTGAALTQGTVDGLYHATESLVQGVYSGIMSSCIALALKVGKEGSYLSSKNIIFLESFVFTKNSYALRFAETHLNPWIQKSFNTSCLHWFFVGAYKAPILNLFLQPPKYAFKNGADRALQVDTYFGLIHPEKKQDPQSYEKYGNMAFFTACLVSGTISVATGIILYQTAQSPDFPNNLKNFIRDLQEIGRKAISRLAF